MMVSDKMNHCDSPSEGSNVLSLLYFFGFFRPLYPNDSEKARDSRSHINKNSLFSFPLPHAACVHPASCVRCVDTAMTPATTL